jgi:hypothetical protein
MKMKIIDEKMIPYGSAYINGFRIIFNPYFFKSWGKNKNKVECYYRKGKGFRKIILNLDDIKLLKDD